MRRAIWASALAWGCAAAVWAGGGRAAPAALRVSATPEPLSALPGQPVSLRVRWESAVRRGGPLLRVNRRGFPGRETLIELTGPGGRSVPLRGPADPGPLREVDFQTLSPGESFEYVYELSALAGGRLAPGRYSVRVVYANDATLGEPAAWKGRLAAPTARFVVRRE